MGVNLNYIPWMTILGVLGLGIGYLAGGGSGSPTSNLNALYGLAVGSIVGILLRIVIRVRTGKKDRPKQDPSGSPRP